MQRHLAAILICCVIFSGSLFALGAKEKAQREKDFIRALIDAQFTDLAREQFEEFKKGEVNGVKIPQAVIDKAFDIEAGLEMAEIAKIKDKSEKLNRLSKVVTIFKKAMDELPEDTKPDDKMQLALQLANASKEYAEIAGGLVDLNMPAKERQKVIDKARKYSYNAIEFYKKVGENAQKAIEELEEQVPEEAEAIPKDILKKINEKKLIWMQADLSRSEILMQKRKLAEEGTDDHIKILKEIDKDLENIVWDHADSAVDFLTSLKRVQLHRELVKVYKTRKDNEEVKKLKVTINEFFEHLYDPVMDHAARDKAFEQQEDPEKEIPFFFKNSERLPMPYQVICSRAFLEHSKLHFEWKEFDKVVQDIKNLFIAFPKAERGQGYAGDTGKEGRIIAAEAYFELGNQDECQKMLQSVIKEGQPWSQVANIKFVELFPEGESFIGFYGQAMSTLGKNEFEDAIKLFKKASDRLEQDENDPRKRFEYDHQISTNMSVCYFKMKANGEAVTFCQKQIEKYTRENYEFRNDPITLKTLETLAKVEWAAMQKLFQADRTMDIDKVTGALEHFSRYCPAEATDADYMRGQLFKKAGRHEEAIAAFQNVGQSSTKLADARLEIGVTYLEWSEALKANNELDKSIEIQAKARDSFASFLNELFNTDKFFTVPEDKRQEYKYTINLLIARLEWGQGNFDKSISMYEELRKSNPDKEEELTEEMYKAYLKIAQDFVKAKEYEKAKEPFAKSIKFLDKILVDNPTSADNVKYTIITAQFMKKIYDVKDPENANKVAYWYLKHYEISTLAGKTFDDQKLMSIIYYLKKSSNKEYWTKAYKMYETILRRWNFADIPGFKQETLVNEDKLRGEHYESMLDDLAQYSKVKKFKKLYKAMVNNFFADNVVRGEKPMGIDYQKVLNMYEEMKRIQSNHKIFKMEEVAKMREIAMYRVKAIKLIEGQIIPLAKKLKNVNEIERWYELLYHYYFDNKGATDLANVYIETGKYEEAMKLYIGIRSQYNQGEPKWVEAYAKYMEAALLGEKIKEARSAWGVIKGATQDIPDWVKEIGAKVDSE